MSIKSQSIRKKAQNYVRKREWLNAIKEYKQLVELEQNNPNVFNELGDLHLKANQKSEAFASYEKAIESYQRVHLYNNAIAVCKKILRLNPNHLNVFFTLGQLRKAQGITREAVTYFTSYMEKVAMDQAVDRESQKQKLLSIADEMATNAEVLENLSRILLEWDCTTEACTVLEKLESVYGTAGDTEKCAEIRKRMEALGFTPPKSEPEEGEAAEPVIQSSDQLWDSQPPSPGERISTGEGDESKQTPSPPPAKPVRRPMTAPANTSDYGNLELGEEHSPSPGSVSVETIEPEEAPRASGDPPDKGERAPAGELLTDPARGEDGAETEEAAETGAEDSGAERDPGTIVVSKENGAGSVVHVSKIISEFQDEVQDAIDTEDFHTHYDLGMAYLEMDLHTEAIREFQYAAKSSEYQVSSLEMIGLCFIKQNQPQLAIKQLEKGLSMVGNAGRDSLGLLYTLAIAYEMAGDGAKAKEYFEDVYVVDVSFRNVSEKIEKYTT